MNRPAVELKNIQKIYKLYTSKRRRLLEAFWPFGPPRHETFFALKNINFSLQPGQSLGIVGRNGSGKSTLLKIISGVLAPSAGQLEVSGSIGCLLELGGGFNSELSGLENARLQLIMSGKTREDEEKDLAEIIAFSELGGFINHPVKTYSSGMFMRLAFACATAISPDILIVDEALAVGDAYFVKKCMNRMHSLLENGATLLFVSHDLEAVRHLCRFGLLLDRGEQLAFGSVGEIAERYTGLLRMDAQARRENSGLDQERPQAPEFPEEALHNVSGAIDLAEPRLYVSGLWNWRQNEAEALPFRRTDTKNACAAFRFWGSRLQLSFIRGGGFTLPKIYVDGRELSVSTENDMPFYEPSLAPAQVRSFTQRLGEDEHTVRIYAPDTPVAWLGGACATETPPLVFKEGEGWEKSLSRRTTIYGDRRAQITCVELLNIKGEPVQSILSGEAVRMRIHAKRSGDVKNVSIGYKVYNRLSVGLFGTTTREEHYALDDNAARWTVEFLFTLPLPGGAYSISAAIVSVVETGPVTHHYIDLAALVDVNSHFKKSIWGEFYHPAYITAAGEYEP